MTKSGVPSVGGREERCTSRSNSTVSHACPMGKRTFIATNDDAILVVIVCQPAPIDYHLAWLRG